VKLASLTGRALSVALVDPFVIATGRIDTTQSVEVRAVVDGVEGLGEAAALPGVTRETQADVLRTVEMASHDLVGREVSLELLRRPDALDAAPVARAGIETAILDAIARIAGVPLRVLLGGEAAASARTLVTDVTIPILEPTRMGELARSWAARGFTCFKVKVGKDRDRDLVALESVFRAVPNATFRIDANAGFSSDDAIALAAATARLGLVVECWEQPCAKDDLEGMARVAALLEEPVIADESVATLDDLLCVRAKEACDGVNLKLSKSGGPSRALAIGRSARAFGMPLMIGGMVETRLGMSAAAHLAAAVAPRLDRLFVDLDTAFLLAADPYAGGGYTEDGPRLSLSDAPGLAISRSD
jgi:L-alanine-DL-glutamate epimerase-like enolase superfamily enzyme